MGQINLSISKIAELTGKDRRTVTKRLSGIKPAEVIKGAKNYESSIALAAVLSPDFELEIRNKISAEKTPDHAGGYDGTVDDNRIKRAKAEKLEMEVAERRRELIPINEIISEVEKEYGFIRTNLMSIPAKNAKILSELDSPAEIQKVLDASIFEVLKSLTVDNPA
jgi:phage terminase Nu1 subunit (DNA packaging protein)